MRQAGVLAAAGIVALEKMITRLSEDHVRAAALARGLTEIPGISLELGLPQSNMVFPSLTEDVGLSAGEVAEKLAALGVKVGVVAARRFRLVTHYWISDKDIEYVVEAFHKVLSGR